MFYLLIYQYLYTLFSFMTDVVIKSIYKKVKNIYSKDFVLHDPSFGKKSSLILTATTDYIRHTSVITSVML